MKQAEKVNTNKVINSPCWRCAVVAAILVAGFIFMSLLCLSWCKSLYLNWQMFLAFASALTISECWLITCITIVYIKKYQIRVIEESEKENSTLDRAIIEKALSDNPIRCCRCRCKKYIVKKEK